MIIFMWFFYKIIDNLRVSTLVQSSKDTEPGNYQKEECWSQWCFKT